MRSLLIVALLVSVAHADGKEDGVVLAPITDGGKRPVMVQPPEGAKKPAIVASVVAGGLVAAAGFSYIWSQHVLAPLDKLATHDTIQANDETRRVTSEGDRWHTYSYWLGAGSIVSIAIAGYLWTRTEPRFVPQVAASPHGGTVGFAGSF
jgi:hypothetical protein